MHISNARRVAPFFLLIALLFSIPIIPQAVYAQQPATVSSQVDWSPDGKLLAVANSSGLTLYDANLQPISPAINNIGRVVNFSWSSDSRYIVSVHLDAVARIWEVQIGQIVHTLKGHTERLTQAVWGLENTQIATVSYDKSIRVWDVATEKTVKSIVAQNGITDVTPVAVAWIPKGKLIAVVLATTDGSGSIVFWNLNGPNRFSGGINNTFDGTTILWRSLSYIMEGGA